MLKSLFTLIAILLMSSVHAADSFYCSQNHAYITVGQSNIADVLQACGPPSSRRTGSNTVMQQIPERQLIYNNLNKGAVSFYPGIDPLYQMWSLPSGSKGVTVQINVVNGKVSNIILNQQSTNGLSACSGGSVQIGDDVNQVFNACGSPDILNDSYTTQMVPKEQNPETWVYDNMPYQPGITLTFINGILQFIQ